jgi:hypothetical protein
LGAGNGADLAIAYVRVIGQHPDMVVKAVE